MRAGKRHSKPVPAGAFGSIAAARARLGMTREDAGWTTHEYMQRFQVNYAVAKAEITRLVEAAELVKGQARRLDARGILRRVNVYRSAGG